MKYDEVKLAENGKPFKVGIPERFSALKRANKNKNNNNYYNIVVE